LPTLRQIKSSTFASHSEPRGAGTSSLPEDLGTRPLRCVPELLRGFDTCIGAISRRAGLPPTLLDDAEGRIDFAQTCRLMVECADVTGCPHFGLLVGRRAGAGAIGTIGDLARHSASVGKALRALTMHLHLHDRSGVLGLRPRGPLGVELAYVMHRPGTAGSRHIAEGALAIAMQVLRVLCGPHWAPIETTFACDRPQDIGPYRDCFGPAVRFNTSWFAIGFHADWLDRPIAGADPREYRRLASLVSDMERARPYPVSESAREALTRMLVATAPSVDAVAKVLGLSPRTLNRRLAQEGTTFRALLEDTRYRLARQLLEHTRMPAIEIAAALHYTTPSAFSRAFSHWTDGTSPRRIREAAAERRMARHRSGA
jgi:AraC-like DNA-binding protein